MLQGLHCGTQGCPHCQVPCISSGISLPMFFKASLLPWGQSPPGEHVSAARLLSWGPHLVIGAIVRMLGSRVP